jgi:hypothetical protein
MPFPNSAASRRLNELREELQRLKAVPEPDRVGLAQLKDALAEV